MFLNSFLSGFFYPLNCYTHFAEKVHPLRNALFRYSVTFNNNVANLVTLGSSPDPNIYYRTEDLQLQMKRYLYRSNRIPMSVLNWKSPIQKRLELESEKTLP